MVRSEFSTLGKVGMLGKTWAAGVPPPAVARVAPYESLAAMVQIEGIHAEYFIHKPGGVAGSDL